MYKLIGTLKVENGLCEEIHAVFDESNNRLIIEFSNQDIVTDIITLNLSTDKHGITSDIDKWQMKCLDLAAELYGYELDRKPTGLFAKLFRRRWADE